MASRSINIHFNGLELGCGSIIANATIHAVLLDVPGILERAQSEDDLNHQQVLDAVIQETWIDAVSSTEIYSNTTGCCDDDAAYGGDFVQLSAFDPSLSSYGMSGTAYLAQDAIGIRTSLRVTATDPGALVGLTFKAHLHDAPCSAGAGGHYQDPDNQGVVDDVSENWPELTCGSDGICIGAAASGWQPTAAALAGTLSIVIHDTPRASAGSGAKMMCADLLLMEADTDAPVGGVAFPVACRQDCDTRQCGTVSNLCGGELSCGTCRELEVCTSYGMCEPQVNFVLERDASIPGQDTALDPSPFGSTRFIFATSNPLHRNRYGFECKQVFDALAAPEPDTTMPHSMVTEAMTAHQLEGWEACSSPFALGDLADGFHAFYVRLEQAPHVEYSVAWRVDTGSPTTFFALTPPVISAPGTTAHFVVNSSENVSRKHVAELMSATSAHGRRPPGVRTSHPAVHAPPCITPNLGSCCRSTFSAILTRAR